MSSHHETIHVIIPAGGSGQRFSSSTKKQFLMLGGKSILDHTVAAFLSLPEVVQVVVAVPKGELHNCRSNDSEPRLQIIVGGATRSESVYRGFENLKNCHEDSAVLIHDAVRPLLSSELVLRLAAQTRLLGAVIPALKLTDTIKKISQDGTIEQTLDRNQLYGAQTPQGFLFGKLQRAYKELGYQDERFTDESLLMEAMGEKVFIVEGERENIKITTPFDLEIAKMILARSAK